MGNEVKRNFILQQGFAEPAAEACSPSYSALLFQGRVVLVWVLVGIILRSPLAFACLCVALWWSAALPRMNPFDALYNATFGRRRGAFRLTAAPPPRRTAQGIAGVFALGCALFLQFGFLVTAYVVEGIFLAAVLALVGGGFCAGSFVYHLLRGHVAFACETAPWARQKSLKPRLRP